MTHGLDDAEVSKRREGFGYNELTRYAFLLPFRSVAFCRNDFLMMLLTLILTMNFFHLPIQSVRKPVAQVHLLLPRSYPLRHGNSCYSFCWVKGLD